MQLSIKPRMASVLLVPRSDQYRHTEHGSEHEEVEIEAVQHVVELPFDDCDQVHRQAEQEEHSGVDHASEDGVVEVKNVNHVLELPLDDGDLVCRGWLFSGLHDGLCTWHQVIHQQFCRRALADLAAAAAEEVVAVLGGSWISCINLSDRRLFVRKHVVGVLFARSKSGYFSE